MFEMATQGEGRAEWMWVASYVILCDMSISGDKFICVGIGCASVSANAIDDIKDRAAIKFN